MESALGDTPVTYEDLAELEREADDIDTELMRHQVQKHHSHYIRRSQIIAKIPNFWPLVLEQAPPEIDQYIQPSDSPLLLSSPLTSLEVSHFELLPHADKLMEANGTSTSASSTGEPRSISITMRFSENPYFTNHTLQKKFWYRHSKSGWCGLVSEPVRIDWKEGKDLTGGLLDLACDAYASEWTNLSSNGKAKDKTELTTQQNALKKKIDSSGLGGVSFFAWFGYTGRRISAEESREATEALGKSREERQKESEKDEKNAGGESVPLRLDEEEEEDETDGESSLEIFPDGDELAIAISEDLWPGAIKYFTQAQEQGDALSDADFESDDGIEELAAMEEEEEEDAPPAKKARR